MVQWALIIVRYTILSRILNTSTIIVSFPISEHFPTFAAWNHSISHCPPAGQIYPTSSCTWSTVCLHVTCLQQRSRHSASWSGTAWRFSASCLTNVSSSSEAKFSISQMSREKHALSLPWRENFGQSFVGVVAKALDDNYRRYNH